MRLAAGASGGPSVAGVRCARGPARGAERPGHRSDGRWRFRE